MADAVQRQTYATYIHTTPSHLWAALTTPALTRRYFDFMVGFLAVDSSWMTGAPIAYRTADGRTQIEGQVLAVDPPRQLAMAVSLRYDPALQAEPASRLTWEATPMGEVCKLVVTYDNADDAPRTAKDVAVCLPAILSNLTILLETGKPRLIKEIVVDCASPATLGIFWAAALGYIMQGPLPTADDDFVAIVDPTGVGPELGFQRVPEPKRGKNRVHLDLHMLDRAAEVARLVTLGATEQQSYVGWTVMADPEGNEFCVVTD